MRAFLTFLFVAWCAESIDAPCRAQTPQQEQLHVRLNAPAGSGLLERVVGQVSDLPVVIQVVAEGDVQVTVGVAPLAPIGWQLVIQDHARGQIQTRDVVGDPTQDNAQSAVDEAAALVVRTVLQSLLQALLKPSPPPEPAPLPTVVVADAPPVELDVSASKTGSRVWLALGPQLALGVKPAGALASVVAVVGVQHGHFALGVQAGLGLPAQLEDAVARAAIARHALHLVGRVDVVEIGSSAIALALALGTHVFVRDTERVAAGWQATDDASVWSPSVGVASQWRWRLSDELSLGVSVGAELFSRVPTLRHRTVEGERRELAAMRWFSPHAACGVELSL